MQPQKMIFKDGDALSEGIAHWLLQTAKECIAVRGRFVVVLSGGNTPGAVFKRLAQPPFATEMPWEQCFFFWGDERYVPLTDPQNNAGNAIKLLLGMVPLPEQNYFVIPTDTTPEEDAAAYEQTIRSFLGNADPVFDIVLLGIGDNGHTASLFPHTGVLHETAKLVASIYVEEVKQMRITMTLPLINTARKVAFLVAGEAKAAVLHKVFEGAYLPEESPAQLIKPVTGELLLIGDEAALGQMA